MPGLMSGGASGIGAIFNPNPTFNAAGLDSGTAGLIHQQAQNAENNSAQDYANRDLQGIGSQIPLSAPQNFSSALGGPQNSNMQSALQKRAQKNYDLDLNQLQRQSQVIGAQQQANYLGNAFNSAMGAQSNENANSEARVQAAMNNAKTRSSIISGLFGQAGTAAGLQGGGGMNNMFSGFGGGSSAGGALSSEGMQTPEFGQQFSGRSPSLIGSSSSSFGLG